MHQNVVHHVFQSAPVRPFAVSSPTSSVPALPNHTAPSDVDPCSSPNKHNQFLLQRSTMWPLQPPRAAIHPAAVHRGSTQLCYTDGPILCHEMSRARAPCTPHTYAPWMRSSGRWRGTPMCDLFWWAARESQPADKQEWFHIPVCQTEGCSAVWLCHLLVMPLKDNRHNIDAFCKMLWFPVFFFFMPQLEQSELVFFPSVENAWCCFMLSLLWLLNFLKWIIYAFM